jgi:hypothetical protein
MNHHPIRPTAIDIPTCWSPEQALLIADFLGDIISAIWHVYASDITRYLEHNPPLRPPGSVDINRLDDDIPF